MYKTSVLLFYAMNLKRILALRDVFIYTGAAHGISIARCSKIFFAGVKKNSTCRNCYFVLTLLDVCHEIVVFLALLEFVAIVLLTYTIL